MGGDAADEIMMRACMAADNELRRISEWENEGRKGVNLVHLRRAWALVYLVPLVVFPIQLGTVAFYTSCI